MRLKIEPGKGFDAAYKHQINTNVTGTMTITLPDGTNFGQSFFQFYLIIIARIADENSTPSPFAKRHVVKISLQQFVFAIFFVNFATASAAPLDLTAARLVVAQDRDEPEHAAEEMLSDEITKRLGQVWPVANGYGAMSPWIVVGRSDRIESLLPAEARIAWRRLEARRKKPAEGYAIRTLAGSGRSLLIISGNDDRGVLFGIGHLLRKLEIADGRARLPTPLDVSAAPEQPVRSHQIGYRFKNNTYDGWSLPMFEQQIRDLAIFGANGLQLIAPASDDAADSPLFPAPPLQTLIGISKLLMKYGLDCDLFYPEMAGDYADPATVAKELETFEALVRQIPRLDALHIPGGDPGHTPPGLLLALAEKQAAILRRYHPKAKVWISAQGLDRSEYEEFYHLLARRPAWLDGVFFGPQSRDPVAIQRRRIPKRYPIELYPDIAHTLHAQFPLPGWDPAFALTEGREPIDPLPRAETAIFRRLGPFASGFVTYSEGVTDDVNKILWTRLGWSARTAPEEILRDYARFFVGGRGSDRFAEGLFALERDWTGSAAGNPQIAETLRLFTAIEESASAGQRADWRFESALYRAFYDALVSARAAAEAGRQERALEELAKAPLTGSRAAMDQAGLALAEPDGPEIAALRSRLFDLAARLFDHIRLQLSVSLHGASAIERGANLDRIDASLNDRVWLTRQFETIAALSAEEDRLARLATLLASYRPAAGVRHDDLGVPRQEPHLVRGGAFATDPAFYEGVIDGVADKTPDDGFRLSWVTYAETLYDRPLRLRYRGLDPRRRYRLRAIYAGEDYALPMRLVANGRFEIHPPLARTANPMSVEFPLPFEATRSGRLDLAWTRPSGMGGSGRGHQVAEVWLIPD